MIWNIRDIYSSFPHTYNHAHMSRSHVQRPGLSLIVNRNYIPDTTCEMKNEQSRVAALILGYMEGWRGTALVSTHIYMEATYNGQGYRS